jgi:ArsR family transcriptional regulator, cadmium/lead-responsive transcriptional repressor
MLETGELSSLKAKLFRGLGDPARLAILETLVDGEKSVGEIIAKTSLCQSNCSGHLTCLKECGLVACRRDGRFIYYRLADPEVSILLTKAAEVLSRVGEKIYACTRYCESEEHMK